MINALSYVVAHTPSLAAWQEQAARHIGLQVEVVEEGACLRLRADNATERLAGQGEALGCLGPDRLAFARERKVALDRIRELLAREVRASALSGNLRDDGRARSLSDWLRFGGIGVDEVSAVAPELRTCDPDLVTIAVEDARYAPYLERQEAEVRALRGAGRAPIPAETDYRAIPGLSNEMVERLEAARPADLESAGRIRGITPAALAVILAHTQKRAA